VCPILDKHTYVTFGQTCFSFYILQTSNIVLRLLRRKLNVAINLFCIVSDQWFPISEFPKRCKMCTVLWMWNGNGLFSFDVAGIAFPTCISVNNCICHFSPLKSEPDLEIKPEDIVKMYVHSSTISVCISVFNCRFYHARASHGLCDRNSVCLSVRSSVCPSHSWTVSTWFDLWSWLLHHMVAPSF